jgi:transposase InsO family protein
MTTPSHLSPVSAPSPAGLFRFQVVCRVLDRERQGLVRAEAVRVTAAEDHPLPHGGLRRIGGRSIYRWLKAFERDGFAGLVPARHRATPASLVLPAPMLDFLASQKKADRRASLPELIRRARELGVVSPGQRVDRTTVWRTARRRGIETRRGRVCRTRDTRRFAYPHRLDMVLCDGKHFRAGAQRRKRVALVFLDDATRYGLHAVVGPSESAALFLRGLYETICRHGLMTACYLDRGPGFIALDTLAVAVRLDVRIIHGAAGYPQGHGKVEKFHQRTWAAVLRGLDRRPEVDPDCGALELRLQHYLREVYNHTPHEGLGGSTPAERFHGDERALRLPDSRDELRRDFVVHLERRVSNDHIVSVDSLAYEVPRGLAGQTVQLQRHVLDGSLAVLHDGRVVPLQVVDLARNAHAPRAADSAAEDAVHPLPKTSAELAFERDLGAVVDADGGFRDLQPKTRKDAKD